MECLAKVLIIEDEIELLNLMTETFEYNGFSCDKAFNLKSAKEYIHKNLYDFYIIDLYLGKESGLHLIPLIEKLSHQHKRKIVIASGNITDEIKATYQSVWKFCDKPFDFFHLLNEMINVIKGNDIET